MSFPAIMNSATQLQATLPKTYLLKPRMVQIAVDNLGEGNPLDPFHLAETTQTVNFEILSAVTINPPSATLQLGKKQQFTATVQGVALLTGLLSKVQAGRLIAQGSLQRPCSRYVSRRSHESR
jgi:hypothetical protein